MVIGVSGVAGAGKDLFVEYAIKELSKRNKTAARFAIADLLKLEVLDWCLQQYGINPTNCDRKEKEKIREFLVFHGTAKRRASNGRHWIESLTPEILNQKNNYDYLFVSDVRYNDYPDDEVGWIKNELNGTLVHVSQYDMCEVLDKKHWPKTKMDKAFLPPANEEESRNDPKLYKEADYKVVWEKVNNINKHKYISGEVVQFIEWLSSR
jgi:hypothetical protein